MSTSTPSSATRPLLPLCVLVLGLVSLLTSVSSSMILGLLPAFLVVALGATVTTIGIIEGLAGAAMSFAKIVSGPCSDWLGRRKPLLLAGYGLSAVVKMILPVADSAVTVLLVRATDRMAKGLRDAPRDALLADMTHHTVRAAGFGLRAAFYTLGFVIGPLAATGLMIWSGDNYRLVFVAAVVPAFAGIILVYVGVKDVPRVSSSEPHRTFADIRQFVQLALPFWWIVAIAGTFSLARLSQAFLLLKAYEMGVEAAHLPIVVVIMHVVYAAASYPSGVLADRTSPRLQLGLTALVLIGAHLSLALAATFWMVALGSALWGLQMGLSYGLLKAAVSDAAPTYLRGTAFGIYDCAIGLTTFVASATAGLLWSLVGPGLTFASGAAFATGAFVLVLFWPTKKRAA